MIEQKAVNRHFLAACFALLTSLTFITHHSHALNIDIDVRFDRVQRPTQIYLEKGSYSLQHVGSASDGVFDAYSPFLGQTIHCNKLSKICASGWTRKLHVSAADLNLTPYKHEPWLNIEVLDCENTQAIGATQYWNSPEAALTAMQEAEASMGLCHFSLEQSGFVNFFGHENSNTNAIGGVSIRLNEKRARIKSTIDILPTSAQNTISRNHHASELSLAIFGSTELDIKRVRSETLSLNVISSALSYYPAPTCSKIRLNEDEFEDIVCQFRLRSHATYADSVIAYLSGLSTNGSRLEGKDVITIE